MIRRNGPQQWNNLHVTKKARLRDLIDIDNSVAGGEQAEGFDLIRRAAGDLDGLAREAAETGVRIRALGSGWALTDIAVTDGWLINTKLLNGCFELAGRYFDHGYPEAKRPYLVIAQCGASIGELNAYLEVTAPGGLRRALKTAGIGAGQTIAGAISGNTHGSAVNFGAMPDFVAGLHVVTGSGRSLWIERASQPVLNGEFAGRLEAEAIRDDDVFNAAVVSFGAFGIIAAVAIETDPIYQLKFPPVADISHDALKRKLDNFDYDSPPGLYHYEFIFDPYSKTETAIETLATREPFEPGHPAPEPVWIVRNERGFAPGDRASSLAFGLPLPPAKKTALAFRQYRERCILGDVRSTPGQLFTATVTYLEGNTESAVGVSIRDAARAMEISAEVIRRMKLPAISQVRMVHPSQALLGFTRHAPKTVVFEFGLADDANFPRFEESLAEELTRAGIAYTFHWSKNSGLDARRVDAMYGAERITKWRAARSRVLGNDASRMKAFENDHLRKAGLA